jgi:hypothetical protein
MPEGGESVAGVVGVFVTDSLRVVKRRRNARVCLPQQGRQVQSSAEAVATQ